MSYQLTLSLKAYIWTYIFTSQLMNTWVERQVLPTDEPSDGSISSTAVDSDQMCWFHNLKKLWASSWCNSTSFASTSTFSVNSVCPSNDEELSPSMAQIASKYRCWKMTKVRIGKHFSEFLVGFRSFLDRDRDAGHCACMYSFKRVYECVNARARKCVCVRMCTIARAQPRTRTYER